MSWTKNLKISQKISNVFFWGIDYTTVISWNLFLKTFPAIVLFVIKQNKKLKNKLKEMLTFLSKVFDLTIFLWGIDYRIIIGWNLFKHFSVIIIYLIKNILE
jgi:hypothetical protein